MSYLILPHVTTSYPVTPSYPNTVLLYPTPSNDILHRSTLDSTPSYIILSHLTTSYHVALSYPILHFILLPSYLTSNPVLLYPTPYNHILPRPTLESLPCPTLLDVVRWDWMGVKWQYHTVPYGRTWYIHGTWYMVGWQKDRGVGCGRHTV